MSETNAGLNKRRYPRLSVSVEVQGQWWDLENARRKTKLHAVLVVVSEGGVMLRCAEALPANSRVSFPAKLGAMRKMDIEGTVRWWRRVSPTEVDLGVEFEEPNRRLGTFVEKQIAAQAAADAEAEAAARKMRVG